ncbi:hypothetical protein SAMN04487905_10178 [Actinopolyspora xinjiangensis]|uniref:FtsX-like permease family protein n=1 Tax=Actinopolyspora xinjiangensis TaxID=405564 RepID=A0A1H0NC61_9ACTN|nr:hypothetical protein [Actinopolyspora xinjiangensis]SDO90233.1 hypothetical protein SAMN04487905_10178 [Actinopolyspora xinjiangensis]
MRVKLVVSGLLLGVLSAFAAWAVHWSFEDHQEATYELPGAVTKLSLGHGPQEATRADSIEAAVELREFLAERSLAVVIAPAGDGPPRLVVADPGDALPWYTPPNPMNKHEPGRARRGYVFEGTYSQRQWRRGSSPALVPEEVEIVGTVSPPEDAGDLQYVRPLGDYPLPPGQYLVNTDDPGKLAEIRDIAYRAGFADFSTERVPLWRHLRDDPLVGTTGVLLGAGYLAAVLCWTPGLRDRAGEFAIRTRHGATRARLVRQVWPRGLPFQLLGIALGVAITGVLVSLVGLRPPDRIDWLVMAAAITGGLLVAAPTWLLAAVLGTRVRSGVGRAE